MGLHSFSRARAAFVADPAHVRTGHGDRGLGCQVADEGVPAVEVVLLGLAGWDAAQRAVEPDLVHLPVLGEHLVELVEHVRAVVGGLVGACSGRWAGVAVDRGGDAAGGAGAAVGVDAAGVGVLVGRGDVHADLQAVFAGGVGEGAQDVAPAVAPAARGDGVGGVAGGVEDEAVVVLDGEDGQPEPGRLQLAGPLIGVETGRLEQIRVLVAVAPFPAGEGVDAEVQEGGLFEALPVVLARGGPEHRGLGHQRGRVLRRAHRQPPARLQTAGGERPFVRGRGSDLPGGEEERREGAGERGGHDAADQCLDAVAEG